MLKNQLTEVRNKLAKKGFHADEINKMTAPAQELVDDTSFWQKQSDFLAIFIAENFSKVYTLPCIFRNLIIYQTHSI